jgi:hypothetical protein
MGFFGHWGSFIAGMVFGIFVTLSIARSVLRKRGVW